MAYASPPPMSVFSLSAPALGTGRDSAFCLPSRPHCGNVNTISGSCHRECVNIKLGFKFKSPDPQASSPLNCVLHHAVLLSMFKDHLRLERMTP